MPTFGKPLQQSKTLKFFVIALLALGLLLPVIPIYDLVQEREDYRQQVIDQISRQWGGNQTLTGPVLKVPVTLGPGHKGERQVWHILPEQLQIDGVLRPEQRQKGIFKVQVYKAELTVEGRFSPVQWRPHLPAQAQIHWQNAQIEVGLSDLKGLNAPIRIHSENLAFTPDQKLPQGKQLQNKGLPFRFKLHFNGTGKLEIVPVGATTQVELKSKWPHPSYVGAFLPDAHQESPKTGFTARWSILKHNRSFEQHFLGPRELSKAAFGVDLIQPVNHYQKVTRLVKYALLFIGLTFLTFYFIELLTGGKVHPVQYVLVGLALVAFYTLLLSLSEHLGFTLAYWIAAAANVGLITLFAGSVFPRRQAVLFTGLMLAFLYGFLFTTVQLEDYALLVGSVGLFLIIAVLLYLSRRIQWYSS